MSETNSLTRPLGNNVPLPGGEIVDTPEQRLTLPGGAPGGGPEGPSAPPPQMSFDQSRQSLTGLHNRNRSIFEATGKALRQFDYARKGLEKLTAKVDTVTLDDVIEEVGKLVAHGIAPEALAGMLADAPQEGGGEALAAWVAGHAQRTAAAEQQMMMQHSLAKHNMGVSALHMLMAHANGMGMAGQFPGPPPSGPNPLMGA